MIKQKNIIMIFLLIIGVSILIACDPESEVKEPLTVAIESVHVAVRGLADGVINLKVTGGVEPYKFLWSNGENTKDIGGLKSGVYSVSVTDQEGIEVIRETELLQPAPGSDPENMVVNSRGMRFRLIHGGTAQMGADTGRGDESPKHKVNLSSFYFCEYEVTQKQFAEVMGKNPSDYKSEDWPVTNITWYEAKEFCSRLSTSENKTYRLPTEAEWEYAASVGIYGFDYVWGNSSIPEVSGKKQENVADESFIAVFSLVFDNIGDYFKGYSDGMVYPEKVGSFAANGFGLYDMGGNVSEWCSDWYSMTSYSKSELNNPAGPGTGDGKCIRGGSFANSTLYALVRARIRDSALVRSGTVGFRVVLKINN